ncbi:MAG: hypothetical protein WC726_02380 [Parcubacteria group bacterium]|jgi:hypothetical protein
MFEIICEKVILSGHEIEHYRYIDKPIYRGYKRRKRKEKKEPKKQTEKSKFSVHRTITEIRRIISNNPQLIKFLTLTFRGEITDVSIANHLFNLFTQRMKDKYPEFQYFAVIEFQKRGVIHFHLLCNLRYVVAKKIEKIWGQGFVKIKRKRESDRLREYLSKYLWKDMRDERLFKKKKYFCSQDLERSTEIINDEANFFMKNSDKNFKFIEKLTFSNAHTGECLYRRYNFKNYKP